MDYKKTSRDRGNGTTRKVMFQQIHTDFPGNDLVAQRARLYLELMNPSQRVSELHDQGKRIDILSTRESSEAGRAPHRQARDVLVADRRRSDGFVHPFMLGWLLLAAVAVLPVGVLRVDTQQRMSKTGKPVALARVSVPVGDEGRVSCSLIAFESETVTRLLQLRAGASVAVAGTPRVSTYTVSDRATRPSIDLVTDEVVATTPRPKTPKAAARYEGRRNGGAVACDAFSDLSGAGNLDWTEA